MEYPDMITGEWYEGDQIAESAIRVMDHPKEPSWGFYKWDSIAWDDRGLVCLVDLDVQHAKENYTP